MPLPIARNSLRTTNVDVNILIVPLSLLYIRIMRPPSKKKVWNEAHFENPILDLPLFHMFPLWGYQIMLPKFEKQSYSKGPKGKQKIRKANIQAIWDV